MEGVAVHLTRPARVDQRRQAPRCTTYPAAGGEAGTPGYAEARPAAPPARADVLEKSGYCLLEAIVFMN